MVVWVMSPMTPCQLGGLAAGTIILYGLYLGNHKVYDYCMYFYVVLLSPLTARLQLRNFAAS